MDIAFEPLDYGDGVELIDPIDRVRYTLRTSSPVDPTPCSREAFRFPVDGSAAIDCERIELPTVAATYVRDESGDVIAETEHFSYEEFEPGRYSVELCVPLRIYLLVEGELTLSSGIDSMALEFGESTEVRIGVRSKHEQPAGTITTTDAVEDVAAAISALSSSIKTASPERSLPTLRGHPPEIELGDRLSIPDGIEPLDTGVALELPQTYRHVYPAAPLAYYLGADIVPGDEPRLVTDDGFEYSLDGPDGFQPAVERTLKQVFLLDCAARTEGLYPVDLHERSAIERDVDLDFAALYDAPLVEQLRAYLDVPFAAVEDHVPEWKLTTHVSPTPNSIETLPYVVNDLAIVRVSDPRPVSRSSVETTGMGAYKRGAETRSTATSAGGAERTYVQVEREDSLEQAWVGDETPIGVSKATADAYRNRFDREPSTGDISITVVCNDERMDRESGVVDEVYGSRSDLPFEVTLRRDLAADELADVLAEPADFLHYIGHIDDDGFRCSDRTLDAATLEEVGVDAFLLNACKSYHQGMELLEAGAIGGIVTLSDVINTGAIRIGSTVARLLNAGFPLRAALEIAKGESIVGDQYLVIGDGGLGIAQAESGTPLLAEVARLGDDTYELRLKAFATTSGGMGGMFMPLFESNEQFYLNTGTINSFEMSGDELERALHRETLPVRVGDELHWSDDLTLDALRSR